MTRTSTRPWARTSLSPSCCSSVVKVFGTLASVRMLLRPGLPGPGVRQSLGGLIRTKLSLCRIRQESRSVEDRPVQHQSQLSYQVRYVEFPSSQRQHSGAATEWPRHIADGIRKFNQQLARPIGADDHCMLTGERTSDDRPGIDSVPQESCGNELGTLNTKSNSLADMHILGSPPFLPSNSNRKAYKLLAPRKRSCIASETAGNL
jgi:hypothetical protein